MTMEAQLKTLDRTILKRLVVSSRANATNGVLVKSRIAKFQEINQKTYLVLQEHRRRIQETGVYYGEMRGERETLRLGTPLRFRGELSKLDSPQYGFN